VKEIFEKVEVESAGTAAPPCWADSHRAGVQATRRRRWSSCFVFFISRNVL